MMDVECDLCGDEATDEATLPGGIAKKLGCSSSRVFTCDSCWEERVQPLIDDAEAKRMARAKAKKHPRKKS